MLNKLWSGMILLSVIVAAFTGKIGDVGTAAITSSKEAITLGLTLLGVISLWTGLMRIGEDAGMMDALAKKMKPLLRWLFPEVPDDHPAQKHIATNFIANLLGLGWAATPPGLEAMKSLQELNPDKKRASKAMCTFMIINMSSLQLIPINMLAYRAQYGSANPSEIVGPAILATLISTLVGVAFAKIMERVAR